MTVAFLVTTLIVVVTPGIGVLYTLSAALTRGPRAAVIAAIGCTLGILPHALAAIVGLAALLNASALAFQSLKYLGVAYLLYLAWKTWREKGTLEIQARHGSGSAFQVIVRAVAVNLLNPKLTLFFFAFLPQFVSARDRHAALHMLVLSVVFMALTLIVFVGYGLVAAQVRRRLLSQPRALAWLRRTFALSFVGLAARLALADRYASR